MKNVNNQKCALLFSVYDKQTNQTIEYYYQVKTPTISDVVHSVWKKTVYIEWLSNILYQVGKNIIINFYNPSVVVCNILSAALDYQYIIKHTIKYTIRDSTNYLGAHILELEKYECDKDLWSVKCAFKIGVGSIGATIAAGAKSVPICLTDYVGIVCFTTFGIYVIEQNIYELFNRFEMFESDQNNVLSIVPTEVIIPVLQYFYLYPSEPKSLVKLALVVTDGIWAGIAISLSAIFPYAMADEKRDMAIIFAMFNSLLTNNTNISPIVQRTQVLNVSINDTETCSLDEEIVDSLYFIEADHLEVCDLLGLNISST